MMHEHCQKNENVLYATLGVSPAVRGKNIRWSESVQYMVINAINNVTAVLCQFEQEGNHDDT